MDNPARSGRPKSGEKHAAILKASSELFLERGVQGTSMDAVAKRAGVSKQTVYSHFHNKDTLFRACIQSKVESYGFGQTGLAGAEDLNEALLNIVSQFVSLLFDSEVIAMHRVVMGESAGYPRIAAMFYEDGPARTKATVRKFLERQVRLGKLKIDHPHYAAVQLLNMAMGEYQQQMMLNLIEAPPARELREHLERVVDDFIRLYGSKDNQ
jgi:TetR/AcrR family transcriptional repressor of mexJK operon